MFKIGCHLSASKGFLAMGKTAISIGANTFQFFTRNPRGGAAKPLDQKDIDAFLEFAKENNIEVILLNSGLQREDAHSFYESQEYFKKSYGFIKRI